MGSGYVLDFSDSSYTKFFRDVGIDIDHQRYRIDGNSKAKRMRAFWQYGSDDNVGKILKELFEYIDALSPEGAGGSVTEVHQNILKKLLSEAVQSSKTHPKSESAFLQEEFGSIKWSKLDMNPEVESVVRDRVDQIQNCIDDSPLAVLFLAGSALEGLFCDVASTNPELYKNSKHAPKTKSGDVRGFDQWHLVNFIDVASDVGHIGQDVKEYSHSLRQFRNYIHPYLQVVRKFNPDKHTARISWQVLRAAIADLSGER